MTAFELHPLDTLFFRDARPMEAGAGSGGHGASWPLPTVVHEAMRAALLRLAGELRTGKERRGHAGARIVSEAFRSLHTRGPFPARDRTIYLPCPADLITLAGGGWEIMGPGVRIGASDLPAFLRPVESRGRAGKSKPHSWVRQGDFVDLLSGRIPAIKPDMLFESEPRIGVGIDDATGAAAEGLLYTAEHLRLLPDVSLWVEVELSEVRKTENREKSVSDLIGACLPLGGEGRMVRVSSGAARLEIPKPAAATQIKWVLASHAVFVGGWRPGWVRESDGRVMIAGEETARRGGESRGDWRARLKNQKPIGARLVAVRCEKPVHFSGWDLGEGKPKPTLAAAPAGSVYYFEADDKAQGAALVEALHGRTRSDYLGEKGMGLGFCGIWRDVSGRPEDGKRNTEEA